MRLKSILNAKLPSPLSILLIVGAMLWASKSEWLPVLPPVEIQAKRTLEEYAVAGCVLLETADKQGGASGVIIKRDDKWYCWTAAHVVEGLETAGGLHRASVWTRGLDGFRGYGRVKRVVARDDSLDVALLELIIPDASYFSATVSTVPLTLGQELITCGNIYVDALPWFVSRGRVTQLPGESHSPNRYLKQGYFVCADFISYPGCSGGPVYDLHGRLVGIICATFGPGAMLFVPNFVLHEFAIKNNVSWAL